MVRKKIKILFTFRLVRGIINTEVLDMTTKQKEILDEAIFSLSVEGMYVTNEEKEVAIDVLEGKRSFQEVLDGYIAEAHAYARV